MVLSRHISIVVIALLVTAPSLAAGGKSVGWTPLADGLELGQFITGRPGFSGDSMVVILRADPSLWSLDLVCTTESEGRSCLTAREWCDRHGFTAAINAGMFATDYQTHVGYCSVRGHVNSARVNEYQSIAAFCAKGNGVPPFRLFDLDKPGVTLDGIRSDYECVAQNLRLIKRPRENRWRQQSKRWSEAALGEDAQGRILLIFCRAAYSMHDLNEILLSLPLDLVCAQHLEGGPEAQLFVRCDEFEVEFVGSYETDFYERDDNMTTTRIPVVFGLHAREE